MLAQVSFTASSLLWLVGSLIAIMLLFGTMNRRREWLTEALRGFVDRHERQSRAAASKGAGSKAVESKDESAGGSDAGSN